MAADLQIPVAEIWAYSAFGDQMRFTLVQRSPVPEVKTRPAAPAEPKPPRPVLAEQACGRRAPGAGRPGAAPASARSSGPNGRASRRASGDARAPGAPERRDSGQDASQGSGAGPRRSEGADGAAGGGQEARVARTETQVARPCHSSASFATNAGTRPRI